MENQNPIPFTLINGYDSIVMGINSISRALTFFSLNTVSKLSKCSQFYLHQCFKQNKLQTKMIDLSYILDNCQFEVTTFFSEDKI